MFIRLGTLDVPGEEDVRKAYDVDGWDQSLIASRATNEVFLMKEHREKKGYNWGGGKNSSASEMDLCRLRKVEGKEEERRNRKVMIKTQ